MNIIINYYIYLYLFTISLDITLITNPNILYEIGKMCAKARIKLELGLVCLEDYINISKFQTNCKYSDLVENKKINKAHFWKGVIHLLQKEYK